MKKKNPPKIQIINIFVEQFHLSTTRQRIPNMTVQTGRTGTLAGNFYFVPFIGFYTYIVISLMESIYALIYTHIYPQLIDWITARASWSSPHWSFFTVGIRSRQRLCILYLQYSYQCKYICLHVNIFICINHVDTHVLAFSEEERSLLGEFPTYFNQILRTGKRNWKISEPSSDCPDQAPRQSSNTF